MSYRKDKIKVTSSENIKLSDDEHSQSKESKVSLDT